MEKDLLVRVEFDNIVATVKNPRIAEAIKQLIIGKKPKAKGGWQKHMWTKDEDEYISDALRVGTTSGETVFSISRKLAVVFGVTSSAVYAHIKKRGFLDGTNTSKPIEEIEL